MHAVAGQAERAHLDLVLLALRGRHLRQQGDALQAQPGLGQLQRLEVGMEFRRIDGVGALVIALHAAQHDLESCQAVRQVGHHALHGGAEDVHAPLVPGALLVEPEEGRHPQQHQGQQRRGDHPRVPGACAVEGRGLVVMRHCIHEGRRVA